MATTVDVEIVEKDAKGRYPVEAMTDRELLVEAVLTMRKTQDTVEQFIADMAQNPMLRMMAGKFGGR